MGPSSGRAARHRVGHRVMPRVHARRGTLSTGAHLHIQLYPRYYPQPSDFGFSTYTSGRLQSCASCTTRAEIVRTCPVSKRFWFVPWAHLGIWAPAPPSTFHVEVPDCEELDACCRRRGEDSEERMSIRIDFLLVLISAFEDSVASAAGGPSLRADRRGSQAYGALVAGSCCDSFWAG